MKKLTRDSFLGSWAGVPVAWTERDEFDEEVYRSDIARCCEIGAPGVYSGGTTGEFYAMEFEEFKRVARATVEEAHIAGKPAMIGVTSTYTLGAARRSAYAAEIGADAVQAALPFWMEVTGPAIRGYFQKLSAAAGHLALSVYETKRAKRILTVEEHRALKNELPNYLMVKANSGTVGATEEGCRQLTEFGINVFGDEGTLWSQLGPAGMCGCCSSLVYYAPELLLPMNRALADKDWPRLAECSLPVTRLLTYVVEEFVKRRGYLDSAVDRLGGVAGGVLRTSLYARAPYPHASLHDVKALREWYRINLPEFHACVAARLED